MEKKHLNQFEQDFLSEWPTQRWQNERVIIAVSGGSDSVALLRALRATAPSPNLLSIGHYNHKIRSTESDTDEQFVRELGNELQIPVYVESPEPSQLDFASKGEGLESAARKLRYSFLTRTANSIGARYVTTAHTRDDVVETVLHNVFRGTGISGLAGIRRFRRISEALTLVRPLLSFSKSRITEYLADLGQSFRIDTSNACDTFTRNRIRNRLLPLIESEFSNHARDSLIRLSNIAQDTETVVGEYISQIIDSVVKFSPDRVHLDLKTTIRMSDPTRREVFLRIWRNQNWPLQQMSFEHWKRLSEFSANKEGGKISLPSGLIARKTDDRLEILVET